MERFRPPDLPALAGLTVAELIGSRLPVVVGARRRFVMEHGFDTPVRLRLGFRGPSMAIG